MGNRTTQEVLQDHLDLAQRGDIETDIARNFDSDCVLMTTYGTFRGHAGTREAAQLLVRQMGEGGYNYIRQECYEELAFLEWTADTDRASIPDGADSYWIKGGKIRAMTIHYSVHEKGAKS
jgi:hypothetical protein